MERALAVLTTVASPASQGQKALHVLNVTEQLRTSVTCVVLCIFEHNQQYSILGPHN